MQRKTSAGPPAARLRGKQWPLVGTLSLTCASALKLGLQTALLPLIARLLGPESVGLVALAVPFLILATLVSDAGLGNALVRKQEPSRDLESTVFWLSLGLSVLLAAVLALLAWPASEILSQPRLVPIILALTLILPLSGSLSVVNARISREGRFWVFAVGETLATFVSSAAAIVAALLGAGPWSLVIQQGMLWGVKVCWLLPASGFRPHLGCYPSLALPFLRFGLHSVGASLADFANKSIPTWLVGGAIGVAAAGHYSIAYQIVRVPEFIISGPIYLLIFASVARSVDRQAIAIPLALKGLRVVVTLLASLFCGLALVSNLVVKVLLGESWIDTGAILAMLAPAEFFLCIYSFIGAVLMGAGRSDYQFYLTVIMSGLLTAGSLVGAHWGHDAISIAAGFTVGVTVVGPAYLIALSRQVGASEWRILRETISPLLATTVMAIALTLFLRHLPAWHPALQLLAAVLLGVVAFGFSLIVVAGRRVRDDLSFLIRANEGGGAASEITTVCVETR